MSTSPPSGSAHPSSSRDERNNEARRSSTRPDARVNDARRVAISRTAWIAARARNASRHAWPIALVGLAALLATVLVLVLVPRQADRAMRMQLERIPTARDTVVLQQRLDTLSSRYAALRRADSARSEALRPRDLRADNEGAADSPARAPLPSGAPVEADLAELRQRLNRARAVPLTESYRDLALARALAGDARVRMLADSLDALDRERSAYAALGGPDAHYAALTARLNAFGQRLVRIAAARAEAPAPNREADPGQGVGDAGGTVRIDSALAMRDSTSPRGDSASATDDGTRKQSPRVSGAEVRLQGIPVAADSVSAALREMSDSVSAQMQRATRALVDARQENLSLEARRAPIAARLGRTVPPMAMLFAALIIGLSIGYLVALVRELRKPTVGDEVEVERRTNVRVVSTRYAKVRGAPLPDAGNPSYALLHLSLTGMGEVARTVQVIAERPFVASVVALNLGVVAARESRAALVIEDATQPRMLDDWLRSRTIARASLTGITTVAIERDLTFDVLRATGAGAALATPLDRYDITLLPGDASVNRTHRAVPADRSDVDAPDHATSVEAVMTDVVVCARIGATPLAWLDTVVREARAQKCRVRAVLLWSSEQPTP